MNFFKFYIGDYQRDTAHLSITEHGAYVLMLQHYYATERPLPIGKALHRMLRAQDKAERDAIDSVASQFWQTPPVGLVNERADVEITKAGAQAETNRTIALAREARRKAAREGNEKSTNRATNDEPNHSQTPDLNTRPPTPDGVAPPSVEPSKPSKPKPKAECLECPPDVDPQVWSDWQKLRKAKKAPVTETVLSSAKAEAGKAGMALEAFLRVWCARGSQGLEASWLRPSERGGPPSESFRERDRRAAASRIAEATGGLLGTHQPTTNTTSEVIDVTAIRLG